MNQEAIYAAMQSVLAARGGGDPALMSLGIAPSDVHIDTALSNLAVGYENQDFIADEIMPVLNVPARTGKYWTRDKGTFFNVATVAITSLRGRPNEVNHKVGKSDYSVLDYGLMGFVPFDVQAMADSPWNPGQSEVDTIMSFLMLARELRVAGKFVTGNFTGSTEALTGTARWDDYTNSDPAAKIEAIRDSMLVTPNVLILGAKVARILRSHPKFIAYIQSRAAYEGGPTPLRPSRTQVAEAFEVDRVYVPKTRYNTGTLDSLSLSRVWPEDIVALLRVEKTPNIQNTQSFGYTVRYSPAGAPAMQVVSWFDQTVGVRGGTYYKVTHSDQELIVGGADTGYLLTTVVS